MCAIYEMKLFQEISRFIEKPCKSLRLRESLPQILAACKVITSETGARIITGILFDGVLIVVQGRHPDLTRREL